MPWTKVDPKFPDFQEACWRRNGVVLSIEMSPGHAPWDHGAGFQTVLLPENYDDDPEVIEYLARNVEHEEAAKVAAIYRSKNDG